MTLQPTTGQRLANRFSHAATAHLKSGMCAWFKPVNGAEKSLTAGPVNERRWNLSAFLGCALGGAFFLACGGSVSASGGAKAGTDGKADANFDAEGDAAWDQVSASQNEDQTNENATLSSPTGPAAAGASERALLGARHDVIVGEGAAAPCQCLSVVLGQPTTPGIVWTGRRPVTDPASQLVIVLTSDGVACAEQGPGASYMGYETKDGDVVVTVEAAVAGRPVTHGAIIPRPVQGKQVFIQPSGKIPYGRGPAGETRCALGLGK